MAPREGLKIANILIFLFLAAVVGVGLFLHYSDRSTPTLPSPTAAIKPLGLNISAPRSAPDFKLPDHTGKTWTLKDYQGKVIVLHFWASWCPPCLPELPAWLEFSKKWESKKVHWLAVSLDEDWEGAEEVLKSSTLSPQVQSLLDKDHELSGQFGTYQYPETYLLDSQHRVVAKWVGPQNWDHPDISEAIEKTLSATPSQ